MRRRTATPLKRLYIGAVAVLFSSAFLFGSGVSSAQTLTATTTTPKDVRQVYETAQQELVTNQTELTAAQQTRDIAQLEYTNASTRLATAKLAEEAAFQETIARQDDMDTLARTMYMGNSATAIDILLVDSSESFPSALVTHDYLSSVAGDRILSAEEAERTYLLAQAETEAAVINYTTAKNTYDEAENHVTEATTRVVQSRADVASAAENYRTFLINYTPATDEPLLDPNICDNWLVRALYKGGYRGEDLREAWAIAMRESGGRDDAVSPTGDYGIFQFNYATYGGQSWWNTDAILTRDYNIRIAYYLSQGGKTWISWGLDGRGRANAIFYERSGWSMQRIDDHIVKPYQKWYNLYPCVDHSNSSPTVVPSLQPTL